MKKEINQTDGLNQIAFINSDGNQVNIINNPVEHMSWLIQNGKIAEAVEMLSKVYKQVEKLHPLHPLYVYKPVEIGSKIVFEHHPVNKTIAETYPLQFKGKFSIKDQDFKEGETLGEFLNRKCLLQEKISIDMKYIETWIGEHLIDDDISLEKNAVKEGEWFILPRKLPPPIKAKLVLVEITDRVIIDYLELRVTNIEKKENRLVISNIHQENSPVVLTLTIPNLFNKSTIEKNTSRFNIKIRDGFEGRIIAEKTFLEFMLSIEKSSKMSLIDIETQKLFFTAEGLNLDEQQDTNAFEDRLSFLNDLIEIENSLDVQFQLPEVVVEEDLEKIQILKAIVENKEVTSKMNDLTATFDNKEALKKLVYDIKGKPIMITANEEIDFEVFGVEFSRVKLSHKFENLVMKKPERVRKKLQVLDDGETVKVEFKPGTKNTLTTRYSLCN